MLTTSGGLGFHMVLHLQLRMQLGSESTKTANASLLEGEQAALWMGPASCGQISHVGEKEMVGYSQTLVVIERQDSQPGVHTVTFYSITRVGNSFKIYKRNSLHKKG